MNDSPESIINFDATRNTVIRIREQDIVNKSILSKTISDTRNINI
jgi:hypothetical protein